MKAQKKYNRNEFQTSIGTVCLTNHAVSRLRQRAQLSSRAERKSFVKRVFAQGIHNPHKKLPKTDEFTRLRSYLYHLSRRVVSKNPYSEVIWFQDVVFIVSVEKVVITIIQIPEEYRDLFSKAKGKT